MENLKVYVKDEVESEEVQKLLFGLNCYWYGERSVDKNNIVEPSSPYPRYIHTNEFGRMYYCAEYNSGSLKTKQQLKDLVVLKCNSIDDASFKDTFGDIWYVDSTNSYWMFENGIWREAEEPLFKLEPIKKLVDKEVKMKKKEYIANVSGDWRLVESNELVSGRIEVPEGAEECRSNGKFYKNGGELYYTSYNEWIKPYILSEHKTLWQRNSTAPNTSTQDKLKFIEKWLNGEKIQYILGVETEKTQWHNFTEGAMQYIKRSDIKFREAPKYVTIEGIEFKNIESILNYIKSNFDLEDAGVE